MKQSLLAAFFATLIVFAWNVICLKVFTSHGDPGLPAGKLIGSFLLYFMGAVLAICMLLNTTLTKYPKRVSFVTSLGVFSTLASTIPLGLWQDFTLSHNLYHAFAIIFGWFLAGLVIGKMIVPEVPKK